MSDKMPDVGANLVLKGEREYREALSKINAGLKVNYAQMGLAAAAASNLEDSTEGLRKRSEALGDTIDTQRKKVALIAAQLDKATEAYGASHKKTLGYQAALLKAQTALAKLEKQQADYTAQLEDTTEAMEDNAAQTDKMAGSLGDLVDSLGVDLPPVMDNFVDKLGSINVYGAATLSVVAGMTVKLGSMTNATAKAADELLTLSSQTGLSTDQLQEFAYASERVDVASDVLADGLKDLTNSMSGARDGNEELQDAYRKLHIRVTGAHGALRNVNEVFYEVIEALHKMRPGTERNALAMKILGENALRMNPLIDAGGKQLHYLAAEAHRTGYVMDTETLQSFVRLSDAQDRMDKQMETVRNTLAEGLLPVMTNFAEFLGSVPPDAIAVAAVLGGVGLTIGGLTKTIMVCSTASKLMAAANVALGSSGAVATAGLSGMMPVILAVTAGVAALAVLVCALSGNMREIDKASSKINRVTSNIQPYIQGRNARGSRYWIGGRTLVGEEGPEIVDLPRGSRIYQHGIQPPAPAAQASGGGDVYNYIFKVDDIETYQRIQQKLERERQIRRMGVDKV